MADHLVEDRSLGAPGPGLRIDPRFRQRRIEVRRERDRRRLRALGGAIAAAVVVAALVGMLWSPLLAVRHVRVVGSVHTPDADIVTAASLAGHRRMIDVRAGSDGAALRRLPWVARVTVRRRWPSTVIIAVTERSPVAMVGGPGGRVLGDAAGRILAPAPASTSLPVVEAGAGPLAPPALPAPGELGAVLDGAYRPGLAVAAGLPAALASRVVAVSIEGDGEVGLTLDGGGSAVLGAPSDLGAKLVAVLTLLDRVQVGNGTLDVTVPSAPVLTGHRPVATFSTPTGG